MLSDEMSKPDADRDPATISVKRRKSQAASMAAGDHRLQLIFTIVVLLLFLVVVQRFTIDAIERSLENLASETLSALLTSDVTAIEVWADAEKRDIATYAAMQSVRRYSALLIGSGSAAIDAEESNIELATQTLHTLLRPITERAGSFGYAIADVTGNIVLSTTPKMDDELSNRLSPQVLALLVEVLQGETVISTPQPANLLDPSVSLRIPVILVATPIRDLETDQVIGVLGGITNPDTDFSRILSVAKLSDSGETIAFDRDGVLLSVSRFDAELNDLGLIDFSHRQETGAAMTLRDPGFDLRTRSAEDFSIAAQPLTKMVANGIAGIDGMDLAGQRDYRGVEVIAAWRWIDELGIGVATKIDREEAYSTVRPLRWAFWLLFLLCAAATIASGGLYWHLRRLNSRIETISQLGQYKLEEKIGEGGMGIVYRARHAMLRRPTAIKLLKPKELSEEAVARFEREVQLTSELSHPNTVEIYDYGRTRQGLFYYAMEYLDGRTLADILETEGRMPPSRVVHILKQVCGSLAEAHSRGIIHRDIKPLNVVLCQRGGQDDTVKVIDFGLVKDLELTPGDPNETRSVSLRGTPLCIAPERFRDPTINTPKTDVYAVGVLAYNLLTGEQPFAAATEVDLIQRIMTSPPIPFEQHVANLNCKQMEELVMACLSKNPSDRPLSSQAILDILDTLDIPVWTREDAGSCWTAPRQDELT